MKNTDIQERVLQPAQGIPVLILELILIVVSILLMIGGVVLLSSSLLFGLLAIVVGPVLLIADLICFAGLTSVPVSYTHLDVYKRQIYSCVFRPGKYRACI